MQRLGSPSWRLSVTANPHTIAVALFVRESLDLPVPPSPYTPPRCGERIPHREVDFSDAARQEAGRQWLAWWCQLVDVEFLLHPPIPPAGDEHALARRQLAELQRVFDPPAFEALSASPALRTAVLATFDDARGHGSAPEARQRRHVEARFDRQLTRDLVAALIAEHGVSPDRLNASLLLIDAPVHWHHITRPGAAICSTAITTDPSAAESLLRAVFTSGLRN
ncbi:MAG TPA: hypothetical protein VH372_03375 [Actinospica sp.]|nr:hypothetical protein [Actinospica sp.]